MKHIFTILSGIILSVTLHAQISVSVISSSPSCQLPCNGSVTVAASGGTAPYTYAMVPSAQTNTTGIFTNVCAGSYTITVVDASFNTFTYVDSIPTVSSPTITSVNTTPIMPPFNYKAQVNYTGGQPPYYVTWYRMPMQTVLRTDTVTTLNDTISMLSPGDYGVTVTDSSVIASGCVTTNVAPYPFSICDMSIGSGFITVLPNDTVCAGTQITIIYNPVFNGPVMPLAFFYTSDNLQCNPATSNGTYSCNITQTTTFSGFWIYAGQCPPVNFTPITVVVDPCSGVEEENVLGKWEMYPNPGNGVFAFRAKNFSGNYMLEIFDQSGRRVYSGMNYTGMRVDTQLPSGMYFARITCDGQATDMKIAVVRD
ncbi:MAG: hypothetical protein Fur0041_02100 [Bacteroidia bacterium]